MLEKASLTFFYKSKVPVLVSMGCDETVAAMASTEDRICDADALQIAETKAGAELAQPGFLRLWCQPDGPYLSLK